MRVLLSGVEPKTFEPLSFERKTSRKRTCKPVFVAFFRYSVPVMWKIFLSGLLIVVFNGTSFLHAKQYNYY